MKLIEVQRTYKLASGQQITIDFEVGEGSIMRARELGIEGPDGEMQSSFSLSPTDCQDLSAILGRTFPLGGDNE